EINEEKLLLSNELEIQHINKLSENKLSENSYEKLHEEFKNPNHVIVTSGNTSKKAIFQNDIIEQVFQTKINNYKIVFHCVLLILLHLKNHSLHL
ncbi:MAG: hypothetical protein AAFO15_00980, partial [Pseudomonadota bacterium]